MLSDDLFKMMTAENRRQSDAMQRVERARILAWGMIGQDEQPFYLCATRNPCNEYSTMFETRMPLTQADLNTQATLYPSRRIQCDHCAADLVVYGPDPRD